jgi:hypothetical protein
VCCVLVLLVLLVLLGRFGVFLVQLRVETQSHGSSPPVARPRRS